MTEQLLQYVVLRGDLLKLGWPSGALVAQACHAVTAAIHTYYNEEDTQNYLSDLNNMYKVILEANSEDALLDLKTKLENSDIMHVLWIEQPENIPTCLATRPYPKKNVEKFFKKFELFKS